MAAALLFLLPLLTVAHGAQSFFAHNSTQITVYSGALPEHAVQVFVTGGAAGAAVVKTCVVFSSHGVVQRYVPLRWHKLVLAWPRRPVITLPTVRGADRLDIVVSCYSAGLSAPGCGRVDTSFVVTCRYRGAWEWYLGVNCASWVVGAGVPLAAHATKLPRTVAYAAIAASWFLYLGVALPLSAVAHQCLLG